MSWEASGKEIFLLHEYLEAGWSEEMQEACRQIDFENSVADHPPVFVHTEMLEQLRLDESRRRAARCGHSPAFSCVVSAAMISCITGLPVIGSAPST